MKKWIGIGAASVILVAAIGFFLWDSADNGEQLSESEAAAKVIELYGGTAGKSTVSGNEILVEFQNGEGRYSAIVNRDSGQVASMELIEQTKQAEQPVPDTAPGEGESEEKPAADPEPAEQPAAPEPERIISGDEAIAIARKTLDGEVQEVEFIETEDGGYYLVEIENDGTNQEATIQIHAIRGETLTVDWDE